MSVDRGAKEHTHTHTRTYMRAYIGKRKNAQCKRRIAAHREGGSSSAAGPAVTRISPGGRQPRTAVARSDGITANENERQEEGTQYH